MQKQNNTPTTPEQINTPVIEPTSPTTETPPQKTETPKRFSKKTKVFVAIVLLIFIISVTFSGIYLTRFRTKTTAPEPDQSPTAIEPTPNLTPGWRVYSNEIMGLSFQFPASYEFRARAYGKELLDLDIPSVNPDSQARTHWVTIMITADDNFPETVDAYSSIPNIEANEISLNGNQAHKFTFKINESSITTTLLHNQGITYHFTLSAGGDTKQTSTATYQKLLSTINLSDPINTSSWKTYLNSELGYSVLYPSELKLANLQTSNPGSKPNIVKPDHYQITFEKLQGTTDLKKYTNLETFRPFARISNLNLPNSNISSSTPCPQSKICENVVTTLETGIYSTSEAEQNLLLITASFNSQQDKEKFNNQVNQILSTFRIKLRQTPELVNFTNEFLGFHFTPPKDWIVKPSSTINKSKETITASSFSIDPDSKTSGFNLRLLTCPSQQDCIDEYTKLTDSENSSFLGTSFHSESLNINGHTATKMTGYFPSLDILPLLPFTVTWILGDKKIAELQTPGLHLETYDRVLRSFKYINDTSPSN